MKVKSSTGYQQCASPSAFSVYIDMVQEVLGDTFKDFFSMIPFPHAYPGFPS